MGQCVGPAYHGAVLCHQLRRARTVDHVQVGLMQRDVGCTRSVKGQGKIGLQHLSHAPLLKQHDGGLAQGPRGSVFWPRAGAQQRQPTNARRRLPRNFHGQHAAHGCATQHQVARLFGQQCAGHRFERGAAGVHVGHAGHYMRRQCAQLPLPHAGVAGQAGQQNQSWCVDMQGHDGLVAERIN